ncbi:prepilin-type N-terminal cleavage/methylation domain-containing protein [Azonexus sp. IMCC34839]|uniref:prepilin-type N-terminal cleavage/methylation domain-containing protein n=1 Tax=Azonexus sp. IMCC34839 TaxID=3133695 RepID=UPI00399B8361
MRRVSNTFSTSGSIQGFTLVEMIISIVITGIIVSMIAMFGRQQIDAYIDVGNRAELSDAADTALRRIARDLQGALPNSVRVDGTGKILEFVPIVDAGRYRAALSNTGTGDILDFSSTSDNSFDVLGPQVRIPVAITPVDRSYLVVYNTGQLGANVYSRTNLREITTAPGSVSNISYQLAAAPNQQFPFASPQSRFQIVQQPVSYVCDTVSGAIIRRAGYDFIAAQPTDFSTLGGTSNILVTDVSDCVFTYTPAVLQRNGLAVLRLTLTRNAESVQLLHQVEILNTP